MPTGTVNHCPIAQRRGIITRETPGHDPGLFLDGSLYPTPAMQQKHTQATLLVLLLLCLCNPFKDRILNANTQFSARKRMQRYNKKPNRQNYSEKKSRKYENFFFHDKKGLRKQRCTLYYIYAREWDRDCPEPRITRIKRIFFQTTRNRLIQKHSSA